MYLGSSCHRQQKQNAVQDRRQEPQVLMMNTSGDVSEHSGCAMYPLGSWSGCGIYFGNVVT